MKHDESSKSPEEYFKEATDWDIDQTQRTKQSEKRAWWVATVLGAVALLCAVSIALLMPLKSVEYRIIRVDEVTGMVDVVRTTIKDLETTQQEVTDKYWIRRYVRLREGYFYDEYENIYREVGLLSSSAEQRKWFEYFRIENPAAPINQYSNKYRVRIKIRAVVMIGKNLANVHYSKIQEPVAGVIPGTTTYWVATIPYRYVNAPATEAEREINPLGFQVTEGYRIDSETDVERKAQ